MIEIPVYVSAVQKSFWQFFVKFIQFAELGICFSTDMNSLFWRSFTDCSKFWCSGQNDCSFDFQLTQQGLSFPANQSSHYKKWWCIETQWSTVQKFLEIQWSCSVGVLQEIVWLHIWFCDRKLLTTAPSLPISL